MEKRMVTRSRFFTLGLARGASNRARGFTLVELLVVIAIVAMLASLLLPSLKSAREMAKLAACESQERQMGIAMGMYVNDFREAITFSYPANFTDTTQGSVQTRFGYVLNGWGTDPAQNHGLWVTQGYVTGVTLMCPSHTLAKDSRWDGTTGIHAIMKQWNGLATPYNALMSTYAFNGGLTRNLWAYGGNKPWNVTSPYQCAIAPWRVGFMKPNWPILADLREAGQWGYGGSVVSANHYATGYNVLYTDGSVLWISLASPETLVGVPMIYNSQITTHSPLCDTWVNFIARR